MASFFHTLKDNYKELRVGQNPEIDSWPLMESPGMIVSILTVYLAFVLRIGPSIMKNRPAMQLRKTMVAYNGAQVLFSVWLVFQSMRVELPFFAIFSSACGKQFQQDSQSIHTIAVGAWWYFIAKITELLDTVFFVLRKQSRQISFLHVYHHSNMAFFTWCFLKYAPAEQGAIVGMINSIVHVIMYFYYMIAALGPAYKKYLWWKKYMTVIQLIQFCMVISYLSALSISSCGYQRSISYFFIANTLTFLYLFSDFYRKAYGKNIEKKMADNIAQNSVFEEKIVPKHFITDDEAYSQISKDVALLNNKDLKLRNRE